MIQQVRAIGESYIVKLRAYPNNLVCFFMTEVPKRILKTTNRCAIYDIAKICSENERRNFFRNIGVKMYGPNALIFDRNDLDKVLEAIDRRLIDEFDKGKPGEASKSESSNDDSKKLSLSTINLHFK